MAGTTYDSVDVARYLYACAKNRGQNLNATQLQKLLYVTYGLMYAAFERRVCKESPQAWPYGPVFPRAQKRFEKIKESDLGQPGLEEIEKDAELTEVIDATIDTFSGFSATRLSDWSHEDGGPWHLTTQLPDFKWGAQIPDEYIQEYFKKFAA